MSRIRHRNNHFISATLCISLFSYFCYHAVSGDRGIVTLFKLSSRVQELQASAEQTHTERLQLEHKVSLLKPSSLDLDMLDEQARKLLGYATKDEVVYDTTNSSK